MRSKEEINGEIDQMSWFLGKWMTTLWHIVNEGIQDHETRKTIRGFADFHTHISRGGTYSTTYIPDGIDLAQMSQWTLPEKQVATGGIHASKAFEKDDLRVRMEEHINAAIRSGTRELWGIADTVPQVDLKDFEVLSELSEQYKNDIVIKRGAYALTGFKRPDENPDRLNAVEEALKAGADFLVGLPERDDEEGKIGFEGHMSLLFELAYKYKVELQVHVDQMNSGFENGAFRMIQCLEALTPEKKKWFTAPGRPKLWGVHVISPSCYRPGRFSQLANLFVKYNIGVTCAPSAGVSMRQLRSEDGPLHNSLARVIEFLVTGVWVVIGTDNRDDLFVPSGTAQILLEVWRLTNDIREYSWHIMAKLAMGMKLNDADRALLERGLEQTWNACRKHADMIAKTNSKSPRYPF
jgi:hypothetical protein